eukprot:18783-Heterococcus_DN1.PRE.1
MNARTSKIGVAADLTPPQSPQSPGQAVQLSNRLSTQSRISPAPARSPASPKRQAQGWSSESTHGVESRTSTSGRSRRSKRGSPRAIMRRYKDKIKPRTMLYGTFAF